MSSIAPRPLCASRHETEIVSAALTDLPLIARCTALLARDTQQIIMPGDQALAAVTRKHDTLAPSGYALIKQDSQAVGCLFVGREFSTFFDAEFLTLDDFYVLKPFRNRGIVRAVMEHLGQLVRASDLVGIRLEVALNNQAISLYRSCGLVVTGYTMQWLKPEVAPARRPCRDKSHADSGNGPNPTEARLQAHGEPKHSALPTPRIVVEDDSIEQLINAFRHLLKTERTLVEHYWPEVVTETRC